MKEKDLQSEADELLLVHQKRLKSRRMGTKQELNTKEKKKAGKRITNLPYTHTLATEVNAIKLSKGSISDHTYRVEEPLPSKVPQFITAWV